MANVLVFSRLFTSLETKKCLHDLCELEIDLINPSIEILASAIELALNRQVSVYDAYYIALAKEFDIKLITADEKLYASISEPRHIELLSNI